MRFYGLSGALSDVAMGSRGEEVLQLQQKLYDLGYGIDVDGIFGPQTASAVRDFQKANGLAADGIAGPMTWAALTGAREQAKASESSLWNNWPALVGAGAIGYLWYKSRGN